jgi:hypothetical protein
MEEALLFEKRSKNFCQCWRRPPGESATAVEQFLVLFFKKDLLPLAKHKPESFSVFSRAPTCYRCATKIQRAQ